MRIALAGFAVWLSLVPVLGPIERAFLLAPLVAVPLALPSEQRVARFLHPLAALCALASFFSDGRLAIAWLAFAGLIALAAISAGIPRTIPDLCRLASGGYLIVGASWW